MPDLFYDTRDRHILVLGKTGQGKTNLLAWQAVNDIESREGAVCVIDPKGGVSSFAEIVSRYIPENRLDDCIWIDMENPIPLDFMSHEKGQEGAVVADLTYILCKGEIDASAWELSKNISNLLRSLLDVNNHSYFNNPDHEDERCTILDVHRFFKNPQRQKFILDHITDPDLKGEWTPMPKDVAIGRVLSRSNSIFYNQTLRTVLGDPKPRLDIKRMLDRKQILLASLPEDQDKTASRYGALLVSKIQHAMFSPERRAIFESERTPCFLYIDEFRNFRASEDFTHMLGMARSFKLCLTLADLGFDLIKDADVRDALTIIDNYIVLKVNNKDAKFFTAMLDSKDLRGKLEKDKEDALERWIEAGRPVKDRAMIERENLQRLLHKTDPESPRGIRLARKVNQLYEDWVARGEPEYDSFYLRLQRLEERAEETPWTVTPSDLEDLGSYEAVYILANQKPVLEETPDPPPHERTEEQREKLEYIKKRTQRFYGPSAALFGTNRNSQDSSGLSPSIPHNKGDDDDIRGPEA